jgi:lipopolysaccharide/colanic/teichoic acid biosynthesis glycosyltransferase
MTQLAARKGIAAFRLGHDAAKRALDIAVALTLITILAPVLAILMLLVWSTSAGPALFRQQRLGRDRRPFTMLKLRTMHVGQDDCIHREYVTRLLSGNPEAVVSQDSGLYKLAADPRITRVGGWLRKTSLDELPQLYNVLRGEMSLVGPRPVLSWEAEIFGERYQRRFAVRPGLTGLWQVSGRSRLSMGKALELDVEYVARRSFAFDLMILIRTIPAILRGGAR